MKSKIPCSVIRDLLPSYIDKVSSEETNREVKLHLSECEDCKNVYEKMEGEPFEIEKEDEIEINYLKKNKKRNRIIVALLVFAALAVPAIAVFFGMRSHAKFEFSKFAVEAKNGDSFFFGSYEQDGNDDNGKEQIEWIVIRNGKDRTIQAISRYVLDCKPYNEESKKITWEECSLRKWLNDDFYTTAFSENEKSMISEQNLINSKNPYYEGTKGGNDTTDKVFLMPYEHYEILWDKYSTCVPTPYAKEQGVKEYNHFNRECVWWLRSAGKDNGSAAVGGGMGSVAAPSYTGLKVNSDGIGVRPMIVIKY